MAARWATRSSLWRPHVSFAPDTRHYVRLGRTIDYEVWLICWREGQTTGLHDHGGSAGAFTVVEGALRELSVERTDAGRLEATARVLPAGEVRGFDHHHVHDVTGADITTVSLHVYAPALTTMTRYALGSGGLEVLSREAAGSEW